MSCEHHNSSNSSEELPSPKVDAENRLQERGDPPVDYANNAMRLRREALEKLRRKSSHHNPLLMRRPMTL